MTLPRSRLPIANCQQRSFLDSARNVGAPFPFAQGWFPRCLIGLPNCLNNLRTLHICISHSDAARCVAGKFFKSFTCDHVITNHYRNSVIASLAYTLYDRNFTKERNFIFIGKPLSTFFSEDVILISRKFSRS